MLDHVLTRLILTSFRRFGIPTRPTWLVEFLRAQLCRHNQRAIIPRIMAAQATHDGYHDIWAEPGMPPPDILGWFDHQLAAGATAPIAALDLIRVAIAHCAEAVWTTAATSGTEPALASGAMMVDWMGPRTAWPTVGRPALAAVIPADHDGLYLVYNNGGAAVRAALLPHESIPPPSRSHRGSRADV